MRNPREEWLARARKVWGLCPGEEYSGPCCDEGDVKTCQMHEAVATGLAESFYNGVRTGLADLPDDGPVTKRLVEG